MSDSGLLPEDAGEWAEGLQKILDRIPPEWGKWIRCSAGWYPIIVALDEAIAAIRPDYQIYQVKQKFGILRWYCQNDGDPRIQPLIAQAELQSATTDEEVGGPGVLMISPTGWYHTRNPATAPEGWRVVAEEDNND